MARRRMGRIKLGPILWVLGLGTAVMALFILPIYVWHELSGSPLDASHLSTQSSPSVRMGATERHLEQRLAQDGPCPHDIEVVTLAAYFADHPSVASDLPAWMAFPEEVDLFTDLMDDPYLLGTAKVGERFALDHVPCKLGYSVNARIPGGVAVGSASLDVREGWTGEHPMVISPVSNVPVRTVSAVDGAPIKGALITRGRGRYGNSTDNDGNAVVGIELGSGHWTPPGDYPPFYPSGTTLEIYAEGYQRTPLRLDKEDIWTAQPELHEVALEPGHLVTVSCLDARHRDCPGDFVCGASWSLEAEGCSRMPSVLDRGTRNDLICSCPPVGAVLRGMGQSVAIPPDVDHITIDLTAKGSVKGGLDEPVESCRVRAQRLVADIQDFGHIGPLGALGGECNEKTGEWSVGGLGRGDWMVEVTFTLKSPDARPLVTDDRGESAVAIPVAALLPDEHRDVGWMNTHSGSRLQVDCIDSETGDPIRGREYVFARNTNPDFAVGFAWPVRCGSALFPALPGVWELWRLPWIHQTDTFTLEPGTEATVSFESNPADEVEVLGVVLQPHKNGLELTKVDPMSPLAQKGLRRGDVIARMRAMGVPVPMANDLKVTAGLLGIWGTAGVEVFVVSRRDRAGHWVELEPNRLSEP